MIVNIKKSFDRDIDTIQDKDLLNIIMNYIKHIENAIQIKDIPNILKLKGYKNQYRIRIGEYRIGLEILSDEVYLVRFLHRKEIYRYFPR